MLDPRPKGLDVSCFASHTELLPQLPSLKTVRRTVFLTLRPKGSSPFPGIKKRESSERTLFSLARPEGLEPPTFWFVARHSIQLSYERVCSVLFNSENYINTRAVKKQPFSALIFQVNRSTREAVFPYSVFVSGVKKLLTFRHGCGHKQNPGGVAGASLVGHEPTMDD